MIFLEYVNNISYASSKITKKTLLKGKFKIGKSFIKCQNQNLNHINQMEYNVHISDLIQAFPNVENGEIR